MDVLLDPNHSHFILVDDVTGKFGGEINFRANLEAELRYGHPASYYTNLFSKSTKMGGLEISRKLSSDSASSDIDALKVPTVLIVVNGGPNTLKTVIEALDNKTPVVVLEVGTTLFREISQCGQCPKFVSISRKAKAEQVS